MTADLVTHGGDPQVGNLATPINAAPFLTAYINALPAYRQGLSPFRRSLEIGMAHGFFLYGPLALLGPLRNSDLSATAGFLGAIGIISILTIALSLYASANPNSPVATHTTPNPPEELGTQEGWSEFASGFFVGGCSGAIFAYFLCTTPHLQPLLEVAGGVWSVTP